jgi:hypothetical protein
MCVSSLSIKLVWNIFNFLFLSFFNETWFFRQGFEKWSNIKFHENRSIGSQVVPRGQTDGMTDMTNLTAAFRNFTKAPKNDLLRNLILQVHNNIRMLKFYVLFVYETRKSRVGSVCVAWKEISVLCWLETCLCQMIIRTQRDEIRQKIQGSKLCLVPGTAAQAETFGRVSQLQRQEPSQCQRHWSRASPIICSSQFKWF